MYKKICEYKQYVFVADPCERKQPILAPTYVGTTDLRTFFFIYSKKSCDIERYLTKRGAGLNTPHFTSALSYH